jgi:hypothetical protein
MTTNNRPKQVHTLQPSLVNKLILKGAPWARRSLEIRFCSSAEWLLIRGRTPKLETLHLKNQECG